MFSYSVKREHELLYRDSLHHLEYLPVICVLINEILDDTNFSIVHAKMAGQGL